MTDNKIFSDIAAQLRPEEGVRADLMAKVAAESAPAAIDAKRRPRRRLALAASAAAVALVAGLAIAPSLAPGREELTAPPPLVTPVASAIPLETADDYALVYEALDKALATSQQTGEAGGPLSFAFNSAADGTWRQTAGSQFQAAPGQYGTNTQVEGIDESDLVKSDGQTLFIASGNAVILASAGGPAAAELSRIDTSTNTEGGIEGAVQGPVADLMLHGSTLVVLVTEYTADLSAVAPNEPLTNVVMEAAQTRALLYDVSDPTNPRPLTSLGQSGAFTTSRLIGDVVYLVTEDIVADASAVNPDLPETFVPTITTGTLRQPVSAADTWVMPAPEGPRYAVVSSIDLGTGKRVDTQAVLGGSQHVYLSGQNLYLASPRRATAQTPMAEFALPGKTDLITTNQSTDLARISLRDGKLSAEAEGSVPGSVINQFALDEHEGNLRIAVTMEGATAGNGWALRPALFVLDESLGVVGSLTELAIDESIQSVRFAGDLAYVVSFRQVDPLFAIDLSDPRGPKVMSELKIPGFSTYLHPWGEGELLGLGMDGTDEGVSNAMKLSMFDTTDPFNVTEAATMKVPAEWSEALTNHKAVLVDLGRGLIGFTGTTYDTAGKATHRYLVYRYDDGAFSLVDKLPVDVGAAAQATGVRGLTIGEHLYVASPNVLDVYEADSVNRVAAVSFAKR